MLEALAGKGRQHIITDFTFHYPPALVQRGWAEYHRTGVFPKIEDVLARDPLWEDDILLMEYLWQRVNEDSSSSSKTAQNAR